MTMPQHFPPDGLPCSLVTGGTDGIGRAVAEQLADRGDRVIIVGRDAVRGSQVLADLRRRGPDLDHRWLPADLSRLAGTAQLADGVAGLTDRLDAVVLCAGRLSRLPTWTEEGLEENFVLNYLSRYLLIRRLLPLLERSSAGRVVLVANAGVYRDTLDFEDLQYRRGRPGMRVAGRTQFANDLLAVELADRLRGGSVGVACFGPGPTSTSLFRRAEGIPAILQPVLPPLVDRFAQSPQRAADTAVRLTEVPGADSLGEAFYGNRMRRRSIPARARRPDRRRQLWMASEDLVRDYLE